MLYLHITLVLILYCTAFSSQTTQATYWTTEVPRPQLSSCPIQIESLSVTFLVDTTGSMSDDLQQLKLVSDWLMNQVEKRLPCGARQYIMVEFNDPDVGPIRTTTSKDQFAYYFRSLNAWGGGDCPELAILGLKLALESSPFGSIILVLTDASAKDYNNENLLNEVYALLDEKKPQIFFLITGLCSGINDPDFLIYRDITERSFGNVFQISIDDIGKVATYLEFALATPANSTSYILSRNYNSYGYHSDSFHVDQYYSSLLLTASGTFYDIGITGPNALNTSSNITLGTDTFNKVTQEFHHVVTREPTFPIIHTSKGLNVYNYTEVDINEDFCSLFSKGMKFIPTARFNIIDTIKEIKFFCRRLNLALQFNDKNSDQDRHNNTHKLKKKSAFIPSYHPTVAQYEKIVTKDMYWLNYHIKAKKDYVHLYKDNLTFKERECLNNIIDNRDIRIMKPDKGGEIVLFNTIDYNQEIYNILHHTGNYEEVSLNQVNIGYKCRDLAIEEYLLDNRITNDTYEFIREELPRMATIFGIPKIHKNLEKPPFRPIISGSKSKTFNIGVTIDAWTKHIYENVSHLTKDSWNFLGNLTPLIWQKDLTFLTVDVVDLFSSIPGEIGLEYFFNSLRKFSALSWDKINLTVDMMGLVLDYNYLQFQGELFRQSNGVAMGASCAPVFANLVMLEWESQYVFPSEYYKYMVYYTRYLDDLFILWNGPVDLISSFIDYLTNTTSFLKFTYKFEPKGISYLDTFVNINDKEFESRIYRKDTFSNDYLFYGSCHPPHIFKSVFKGQCIRAARMSSNKDIMENELNVIYNMFINRGYPEAMLTPIITYVKKEWCHKYPPLLGKPFMQTKKDEHNNRNVCVLMFSPYTDFIKDILTKHWNLITTSDEVSDIADPLPKFVFKTSNNIKNMLESTKDKMKGGKRFSSTTKCGTCNQCRNINNAKVIRLNNIVNTYLHSMAGNCNTPRVVYVATCTSCDAYYIDTCSACHINATCETYGDIPECICKDGFIGDGFSCSDIDECAQSWTHSCGSDVCVNTFGSYTCRCAVGYIEDTPESGCRDINECAYPELNLCHPSATCINYIGGYYCTCPYGSYGDGFHCYVNDCLLSTTCSSDMECVNTPEYYYCSDPCDNHTVLNENWRSTSVSYFTSWYANCDSAKSGWFRFVGTGGVQMPEYCVPEYSCSTTAPMWLNGQHPSVSDGIVTRTACAHWAGFCCFWSTTINVKACPGGYYVYKLYGTPACNLAYCTDPSIVMNDCSSLACAEDEECKEVNGTLGCYCKKEYESSMYYDFRKLQPTLTCSTSQMKVLLNKCQLDAMGYDISRITLKDEICMGAVEVYNKSYISLTTYARKGYCGTQLTQNKTHVTYSNTIYLPPKSMGIIIREKETYINYHCTYPLDMRVSLDLALNPFISSVNISIGGTATYSAKMALYQNPDFTGPYEGDRIILPVETILYVGVMVEDADGYQFAVVLYNCYATPTRNPLDSLKYYIIKESCPNKQDSTIAVVENGLSLQGRFSVQMFKFVGNYPEVYLHCEISLCDITVGSCVPVCSGMRSSNPENSNNNVTISIGPIRKRQLSTEGSV
ncbi:uncharacterized protein LOC122816198 [Protopterus annectens]|uniref:uncharacterized protein LOC122816198 n=1 Tax=Protopterus annectens TaxID=7888 RepID=UPI001CF98E1F|nr:uncharacterized protein LOC122816198 [Protopterus annectens]